MKEYYYGIVYIGILEGDRCLRASTAYHSDELSREVTVTKWKRQILFPGKSYSIEFWQSKEPQCVFEGLEWPETDGLLVHAKQSLDLSSLSSYPGIYASAPP